MNWVTTWVHLTMMIKISPEDAQNVATLWVEETTTSDGCFPLAAIGPLVHLFALLVHHAFNPWMGRPFWTPSSMLQKHRPWRNNANDNLMILILGLIGLLAELHAKLFDASQGMQVERFGFT
jgi:hypothetical protein